MRIKRNYFGAVKRAGGFIISRFKPLSIHTELIMDDKVWEIIKQKVKLNEVKVWHVMTPVNYELYKTSFNIKLSKEEVSKKMKERYLWMKEHNQNIQLHIHLSLTMKNMSSQEQEAMFNEALTWMEKELGITPIEFVPGWWSFNDDTLNICKMHKLRFINERDYDYAHDYEWII